MERHFADILENMNPRNYDPEKASIYIEILSIVLLKLYNFYRYTSYLTSNFRFFLRILTYSNKIICICGTYLSAFFLNNY